MITAGTLLEARSQLNDVAVLDRPSFESTRQNQLLFFLKPEAFATDPIRIALETLDRYQIEMSGCLLVSGHRLSTLGLMDRHYGYINNLSRSASGTISEEHRLIIAEALGVSRDVPILGGHEVLDHYKDLAPHSLNQLWMTKKSYRVTSGFYAQAYKIEDKQIIIVNGFHPAQLEHFTNPDHAIALMIINSDLPWTFLRQQVIGDTFPDRANPGSIRGQLYSKSAQIGVEVSASKNHCHLSAGPFEALFEMENFFSRLREAKFDISRTSLSRALRKIAPSLNVGELLANPSLTQGPIGASLFEITEGCDLTSAAYLAMACS